MTEIRQAKANREEVERLFDFILPMSAEVALAPVHWPTALGAVAAVVAEGNTWVALDGDEIVGSLGLTRIPFWYAAPDSANTFLIDRWLYVRPESRFGDVGIKLLRAARTRAAELGLHCFVMIANPGRRPPNSEPALYAVVAGYSPFARLLRVR